MNDRPTDRLINRRRPLRFMQTATQRDRWAAHLQRHIGLVSAFQNSDNPAVQLQGPFFQDRVIPPPSHRNVVMIAAGTGVNPSEWPCLRNVDIVFGSLVFRDGDANYPMFPCRGTLAGCLQPLFYP